VTRQTISILTIRRLSFTEHPASVGENYFVHFRHAAGFSFNMFKGGLACMVHAVFPFLCTKTGSGIVATLNTRMIANRHATVAQTRIHRVAQSAKRASAA
jgi:hypothetical protein